MALSIPGTRMGINNPKATWSKEKKTASGPFGIPTPGSGKEAPTPLPSPLQIINAGPHKAPKRSVPHQPRPLNPLRNSPRISPSRS